MKWILNAAYLFVLTLLSPVILYRSVRHGRYRRGWRQKLVGSLPQMAADRPLIWFHAVSVGEVLQLEKLVERFTSEASDRWQILVTTSTDTGFDLAQQRFPQATVSWFPLDFSWAILRALKQVQPSALVLVELELWPNLLASCSESDVTTSIVNARMSDRSFRGYSRLSALLRPTFQRIDLVTAQTQEYADRLRALGVRPERVHVTGSIKFDGVTTNRRNANTNRLRQLFQIAEDDLVLVAGSTQDPEELVAFECYQELRSEFPRLRLIVVPRHRERFDPVAQQLRQQGAELIRRSELTVTATVSSDAVILLDTIGELSACWGLADIALVGGSFGTRGGQNMLEPAAYGAAVLYGPNTSNFRDIVHLLQQNNAAITVPSLDELNPIIRTLLQNQNTRTMLGEAARRVVEGQQGALQQTVELLLESLPAEAQKAPATTGSRSAA
ncbi:MAG: 3-deoxy-D-manno-octulosonic acid transferase [Fuerstiella sp.]